MTFDGMTEAQHQTAVFKWATLSQGKYPELKLLYHIPNGGKRSKSEAANFKRQGVRAGVPDLHLPVSRRGYHSLYIEMKSIKGRTSPEQNWWIDELNAQGNLCAVCHGWESAVRTLEFYLGGQKEERDGVNKSQAKP